VFMVGIGSAPNSFLMTRAAELGRGTFTQIGSVEQVEERMRELFAKLENPAVTAITARFSDGKADVTPAILPDLYRGEPLVLAARLDRLAGAVEIKGRIGDRPWSVTLPLAGAAEGQGLSKLWARRRIADAEVAQTLGQIGPEQADQRILSLALQHHLVTRLTSLVRKEHLPNAIALNSIQFNIARVLGPLLAGVALHQFGSATCFGLNGLSFLVVIAALASLHAPHVPTTSTRRMRDELATGLRYVRDDGPLRTLTVLALASTFLGVPLLTFLPVFTKNIYHADVGQYSQMMAWSGVGAIAGALVVAWLGRFRHMGLTALLVQLATGALVVAFALTRLLWLSHVLLLLTGAAMMITFSLFTSLVQLVAPNEMRGRVMSVYMVAFRGGMPLGSLVTGVFVDQAGAPLALAVNGALLTAVAAWFLVRRRPIGDF